MSARPAGAERIKFISISAAAVNPKVDAPPEQRALEGMPPEIQAPGENRVPDAEQAAERLSSLPAAWMPSHPDISVPTGVSLSVIAQMSRAATDPVPNWRIELHSPTELPEDFRAVVGNALHSPADWIAVLADDSSVQTVCLRFRFTTDGAPAVIVERLAPKVRGGASSCPLIYP